MLHYLFEAISDLFRYPTTGQRAEGKFDSPLSLIVHQSTNFTLPAPHCMPQNSRGQKQPARLDPALNIYIYITVHCRWFYSIAGKYLIPVTGSAIWGTRMMYSFGAVSFFYTHMHYLYFHFHKIVTDLQPSARGAYVLEQRWGPGNGGQAGAIFVFAWTGVILKCRQAAVMFVQCV